MHAQAHVRGTEGGREQKKRERAREIGRGRERK